jgi:DNA-directed RNA polymerase specialized sigma24 family protein
MSSELTSVEEPTDAAANAQLMAQLRPALVNYFKRKCGSAPEAEDLAQDAGIPLNGQRATSSARQSIAGGTEIADS